MSIYFPAYLINPSAFTTLYTLVTITLLYPYFNNEKKYYILLIIFGLLIDISYTNTLILNTFIFIAVSIIIKLLNNYIYHNLLTSNIVSLISVISYHIISFIILNILNYNNYTLNNLFTIIYNSIIGTIIYNTIMYLIIKLLFKKHDITYIK